MPLVCVDAKKLEVGDTFPKINSIDQHEVAFALSAKTNYVLISFDMSTGKIANQYLTKKGQQFLDKNNAIFMANIYGMPWIGRVFALPKMRKYKHRIILADDVDLLNPMPQEKGKITIFKLDDKHKIKNIEYWDAKTEIDLK